jgi:hypothetical protein
MIKGIFMSSISYPRFLRNLIALFLASVLGFGQSAFGADNWSTTNTGFIVPTAPATTRIGIGFGTLPSAMLEIKGTGSTQLINTALSMGTLTAANTIAHYLSATGTTASGKDMTVLQVDALGTGAGINNAAVFTGGRVGIGVTAPSSLFQVSMLGSTIADDVTIAKFGHRLAGGRNAELNVDYRGSMGNGTLVLREDRASKDFMIVNMLAPNKVLFANGNV